MSIVTKTGDAGTTALMYGRRVAKNHPRVEAYGTVDELNAALGVARATAEHDFVRDNLLAIQKDLIVLMGELCVQPEDLKRYVDDGYLPATTDMARTVCRRAERNICALKFIGELRNMEILIYLNRLSDLLWLFARWA